MIIEYHCPKTIEEALQYLSREGVKTVPMGGGTILNQPSSIPLAVVDLQTLELDRIERRGNNLHIGATATLQSLLDSPEIAPSIKKVIEHEATYNLRQVATLAGTLIAADGRSPLTTALLALDVQITLLPGEKKIGLGDLLPVRGEFLTGRLVTRIDLPINASCAYHYVARTPADLPIVCAAAALWPSGRTRLALGGYGLAPILAMDGPEPDGIEMAARSAYEGAQDEWASAEYRQEIAGILTRRCLEDLTAG